MIIVSQNEDAIINFDNVESIDVVAALNRTGEKPYIINYETGSKREALGIYRTEERAKKVLEDIAVQYAKSKMVTGSNFSATVSKPSSYMPVYEMPKE